MSGKLRDHWFSGPGWRPDRCFYAWHITFAGNHEIAALQASYDQRIRQLPGFLPVPPQRLHLSLQGVGFADRVPDADLVDIVEATRRRVTGVESFQVTAGPAVLGPESLHLPVRPAQPLHRLRDLTRAALVDVWGDDTIPRLPAFDPHITLAYSNDRRPSVLVPAPLPAHPRQSASVSITTLALLSLTRTHHLYRWTSNFTVPLDKPSCQADEP